MSTFPLKIVTPDGLIYDGSFSGALTEGDGVLAQLLRERGVPVYGESDIPDLLEKA